MDKNTLEYLNNRILKLEQQNDKLINIIVELTSAKSEYDTETDPWPLLTNDWTEADMETTLVAGNYHFSDIE